MRESTESCSSSKPNSFGSEKASLSQAILPIPIIAMLSQCWLAPYLFVCLPFTFNHLERGEIEKQTRSKNNGIGGKIASKLIFSNILRPGNLFFEYSKWSSSKSQVGILWFKFKLEINFRAARISLFPKLNLCLGPVTKMSSRKTNGRPPTADELKRDQIESDTLEFFIRSLKTKGRETKTTA